MTPLLALDTTGPWCGVCILGPGGVLAARHEAMPRGQAERLMPLAETALAEAGLGWGDLKALGVGVGPGNFTGVRIGVAAARGLAMALGVPAVGVDAFDALQEGGEGPAAVAAPRGLAHLRAAPGMPPLTVRAEALPPDALGTGRAPALPPAEAVARVAARRAREGHEPPAPSYLRAPDAAPGPAAPPVA